MFLEFLKTYAQAIDLDNKNHNFYFPEGVHRADGLLFDQKIVYEHKELTENNIKRKVNNLAKEENLSERDKDKLYKRIDTVLSKANKQIRDTKRVLECQDALGLIILENSIQSDWSALSLIDAAERKMAKGLDNVDCVLCLDFVNTFLCPNDGSQIRLTQFVARDTEKSRRLCTLLDKLMKDFCENSNIPFSERLNLKKGTQSWQLDEQDRYQNYQATIDFNAPKSVKEPYWKRQLVHILNRLWWLMPILFVFYNRFIQ